MKHLVLTTPSSGYDKFWNYIYMTLPVNNAQQTMKPHPFSLHQIRQWAEFELGINRVADDPMSDLAEQFTQQFLNDFIWEVDFMSFYPSEAFYVQTSTEPSNYTNIFQHYTILGLRTNNIRDQILRYPLDLMKERQQVSKRIKYAAYEDVSVEYDKEDFNQLMKELDFYDILMKEFPSVEFIIEDVITDKTDYINRAGIDIPEDFLKNMDKLIQPVDTTPTEVLLSKYSNKSQVEKWLKDRGL